MISVPTVVAPGRAIPSLQLPSIREATDERRLPRPCRRAGPQRDSGSDTKGAQGAADDEGAAPQPKFDFHRRSMSG